MIFLNDRPKVQIVQIFGPLIKEKNSSLTNINGRAISGSRIEENTNICRSGIKTNKL